MSLEVGEEGARVLEDRLRQMGACVGDVARRRGLDLLHEGLGALDDRLREMRREFDVLVEPDLVRRRRQRVLEGRDHEHNDEDDEEHNAFDARVRRPRARHAAARGARQGLAASGRPGHGC